MLSSISHAIWRVEEFMQTIGLVATVLMACVIGILLSAAGIDLEYLARQTAVLSFLVILTFGVKAANKHKNPLITVMVGVGISQGILFFFSDVTTDVLSIMCDIMMICMAIYLNQRRKWI